jgi:hypothetical protein
MNVRCDYDIFPFGRCDFAPAAAIAGKNPNSSEQEDDLRDEILR